MSEIVQSSPAKLNLILKVLGRLANGYHALESLVMPLELKDSVSVHVKKGSGKIEARCTLTARLQKHIEEASRLCPEVKAIVAELSSPKNLVVKAAERLLHALGRSDLDVSVTIEKDVPFAAGLGGGSSNAAACLKALNKLLGSPMSRKELADVGSQVGSDVPAMVVGKPVFVYGTGERWVPLVSVAKVVSEIGVVLVKPLRGVSTQLAYQAFGFKPGMTPPAYKEESPLSSASVGEAIEELRFAPENGASSLTLSEQAGSSEGHKTKGFFDRFCASVFNDFGAIATRVTPEIDQAYHVLGEQGAGAVLLAGSGSCVAGFFRSLAEAACAEEAVRSRVPAGWYVTTTRFACSEAAN